MVANAQDVVSRVLGLPRKKMTADVAREIMQWRFNDADKRRVARLLEKNREGTIAPHELNDLHTLVALGEVVDLLHAEAELTLRKKRPARVN
jgi:hypothetical protein